MNKSQNKTKTKIATLTLFDRFCVAIFDLNKQIEVVKGNT